jgi:hypothetical protein
MGYAPILRLAGTFHTIKKKNQKQQKPTSDWLPLQEK